MPRKQQQQRRKPRVSESQSRNERAVQVYSGKVPRTLHAGHLPSGQVFKFRYTDSFSLNPAAGSYAIQTFRANDLYDPDYTGAGGQPLGFDQVMAWYNHFAVVRARIRVTAATPTLTSTNMTAWGVGLFDDATSAATILSSGSLEGMSEQGHDFRLAGTSTHSTGPRDNWQLIQMFDFEKFFGAKFDPNLANFRGNASASPAELAYFSVWCVPWDGSTDVDALRFLAEIEYDAYLIEPKNLTRS